MSLFSPTGNASRPQLPAPGVAFSLFTESIAHRAELVSVEVSEARDHALVSVLLAVGTFALALLSGFAITLLLASLAWDSPHRGLWLAGLCALYVVAGVALAFALVRRLRTWRPLDETQTQLQEDFQCLSKLIKSAVR